MNFAIAYVGGLLTFLAPCGAFLLPAFFAYAFVDVKTLLQRSFIFLIGLLIPLLPLGVAAGSVGAFLQTHMLMILRGIAALVIILGIVQILAIKIPQIPLPRFIGDKTAGDTSTIGILALGISYGLAGVGCTGPILGAVLSTAITTGSALTGMIMAFCYAVGMFTPIFLLTLLWRHISPRLQTWLRPKPLTVFGRQTTLGSVLSGIIFVILGLLLFIGQGRGNFFAVASNTQINLEFRIQELLSGIPNWIIVLGILLVAIFIWAAIKASQRNKSDSSHISK